MFFIIWGTRARTKVIGRGEFHCPRCNANQSYAYKQVKRWFTLYFIPLFPTRTLGEYVECGSCAATWKPEVLAAPTVPDRDDLPATA